MQQSPLATALRHHVDTGSIAGAAVRFRQGGTLIESAELGYADLAARRSVAPDSLFRLASLTKPVVAVAIMQLVESGDMALDDPLTRFLPTFAHQEVAVGAPACWASAYPVPSAPALVPATRAVTVRDLLTHSSGLGHGPFSKPLIAAVCHDDQTLGERVDAYAGIPGDAQPGATAGYSPQVGFDILGRIVELCTGTDLQAALTSLLFTPLGMPDTTFVPTVAQRGRLVTLYGRADGTLRDDSDSPGARAMESTSGGAHSGAAGLHSTVEDYDRFARMLHNGGHIDGARVLSPASVHAIVRERSRGARRASAGTEWGLGVAVTTEPSDARARGSWGWSGAWGGHLVIDPVNRTSLVLMINQSDIGGAESPISRELEQLALESYGSHAGNDAGAL